MKNIRHRAEFSNTPLLDFQCHSCSYNRIRFPLWDIWPGPCLQGLRSVVLLPVKVCGSLVSQQAQSRLWLDYSVDHRKKEVKINQKASAKMSGFQGNY